MKTINLITLLATGVSVYFLIKNKNKKDNQKADTAIADNTAASLQAQKLYENLNVTSTLGKFHISTLSLHPSVEQYENIFNIGLQIIDLAAVQSKFLKLTNNQYTLNQATADAMSSSCFNQFWQYTKLTKILSTKDTTLYINNRDENNNLVIQNLPIKTNTICGVLQQEDNTEYKTLLNVTLKETGIINKELEQIFNYAYIRKDKAKKINPV